MRLFRMIFKSYHEKKVRTYLLFLFSPFTDLVVGMELSDAAAVIFLHSCRQ